MKLIDGDKLIHTEHDNNYNMRPKDYMNSRLKK